MSAPVGAATVLRELKNSRTLPATRQRPPFYGLVARLTQSHTNAEDDLREQWAYGETHDHCAAAGGHLWLTVNDNEPKDNKGEFVADVYFASCQLTPTGRERQSGIFRIVLNGFTVNRQTADSDFEGKADEVYVVADIFVLYRTGEMVEHHRVVSHVLGDPNGQSNRQPAGSSKPNLFDLEGGGLVTGDSFPTPTPWRRTREPYTDRIPLLLWEGPLEAGGSNLGGAYTLYFQVERLAAH
jgi:hypothetical protein